MAYARTTTVDTGPAGDTIVQGVTDLDTDLTAVYANLNTHEALTETHGATGAIVGTTNIQTLTNKTLTSPTISGGTITSPTITGTGAIAGVFTGNLTGNVTGNVTGDVTGNVTGDVTGNADTATTATNYSSIPSGTKMVFYQDTAPTGWTIANTLDDKVLYVTKGSAASGETGGGVHSSGTWTQPNHVHTTGDFTLTTDEMPSHRHGIGYTVSATSSGGTVYGASANVNATSTYTGGGKAHNHGDTGNGATANTWRPAAYCVIIATKD
jgi:trimeric autotransporter adhesin